MNRRSFLSVAAAGSFAVASGIGRSETLSLTTPDATDDLYPRWKKLDDAIRTWWDDDLHQANEKAIR